MAEDPRMRRAQTPLGRMINRVDNALVTVGAALTFSKQQRQAAKESNRSVQEKVAAQQPPVPALDVRREAADGKRLHAEQRREERVQRQVVRSRSVDTGKPRPARTADLER